MPLTPATESGCTCCWTQPLKPSRRHKLYGNRQPHLLEEKRNSQVAGVKGLTYPRPTTAEANKEALLKVLGEYNGKGLLPINPKEVAVRNGPKVRLPLKYAKCTPHMKQWLWY